MTRSFLNDNSCLQVKWKKRNYYFDIFPADFFSKACTREEKSFSVYWDKKKSKMFEAKCKLTVRGNKAIIDDRGLNISAEPGFDEGIMTIYFTDNKRNVVKSIDWQTNGGELEIGEATSNWDECIEVREGERLLTEITRLSRNSDLMNHRKRKDDYTCEACDFRLEINGRFIVDCHHKVKLSSNENAVLNGIKDLVTLCPNCHRIAHSRAEPFSVKEIKKILKDAGLGRSNS